MFVLSLLRRDSSTIALIDLFVRSVRSFVIYLLVNTTWMICVIYKYFCLIPISVIGCDENPTVLAYGSFSKLFLCYNSIPSQFLYINMISSKEMYRTRKILIHERYPETIVMLIFILFKQILFYSELWICLLCWSPGVSQVRNFRWLTTVLTVKITIWKFCRRILNHVFFNSHVLIV